MSDLFKVAFWGVLVGALVLAVIPEPPQGLVSLDDQIQHLIAFITLGALAALAYPGISLSNLFLRLALFGGAIELIQAIPALHRTPDALDWLADLVGASIGLLAASILRRLTSSGSE